jgi:hypothetical protein
MAARSSEDDRHSGGRGRWRRSSWRKSRFLGSIIYRPPDFDEGHRDDVTAEIPLDRIVSDGLELFARSTADHIKIQVCPHDR